MIDANEGVTPHKKAVMEADIEEEPRMFYVAMTRAKTFLHIYFTKNAIISLRQCPVLWESFCWTEFFVKGTRVRHRIYGEGTITNVSQTAVQILFTETKEIKTLNISFCISNRLLEPA